MKLADIPSQSLHGLILFEASHAFLKLVCDIVRECLVIKVKLLALLD